MNLEEIVNKAIELQQQHNFAGQHICVIDFSRLSSQHRLFVVDVHKQSIIHSWWTTHGHNSGPLNKAVEFSNVPNSLKSSKGLMKTAGTYIGKHGRSLILVGLEPGINDNVERRHIVMHPSNYVTELYVKDHTWPGRSFGCLCLNPSDSNRIIDLLEGGSLVYSHV